MHSKALIAEAIGTFALCFVGAGAIMTNAFMGDSGGGLVAIAPAHGLILSIFVTATMNVSGGHLNPAVTVAMLVTGRIPFGRAIAYIVAQCVGGMIAGVLLSMFIFAEVSGPHSEDLVSATSNGTPMLSAKLDPSPQTGDISERPSYTMRAALRGVLIEAITTALLILSVFGTAVDPRHPNVGGFGIGLTVGAGILFSGPLTGGAMNPARVIGTGFLLGDSFWAQHWVYWVGPISGAIVAALLYQFLVLHKVENAKA